MADVDIIFRGALGTNTEKAQLEVFANTMDNITISLKDENAFNDYPVIIQLSKSTAIRFHRELKKQISFLQEGGQNG